METKNLNTTIAEPVRKQMRIEFFTQIIALVALLFVPYYFNFNQAMTSVYMLFYALTLSFSGYYIYKFYTFYKSTLSVDLENSKDLTWFYHELKLNVNIYTNFNFIMIITALAYGITCLYITKFDFGALAYKVESLIPGTTAYIALTISTLVFLFTIAEYSAKSTYEKYTDRIKDILKQFD
ncbi:hypothetical protein [Sphingobacterium spiritivorum]|uniref:hypothetical protein n=1 Tax=Sphingobacterium spiritivorum TaxID=258 RepID=UPI00191B85A5|nr:hypothetical protein [Sphingobacterium spiritivorum]QQT26487.1 hypothetical protein I6J02_01110 [Sphingobacterium spiritivorum]